jgi:hypothetical protein
MEPKPGDKLGPCELVAPVGAGGMGEVWHVFAYVRLSKLAMIRSAPALLRREDL